MFIGIFVLLALNNFFSFSHSFVSRNRCLGLAKLSILYLFYTNHTHSNINPIHHSSNLKFFCKMIHKTFVKVSSTNAQLKAFSKNLQLRLCYASGTYTQNRLYITTPLTFPCWMHTLPPVEQYSQDQRTRRFVTCLSPLVDLVYIYHMPVQLNKKSKQHTTEKQYNYTNIMFMQCTF